jgi:hypothetical protein
VRGCIRRYLRVTTRSGQKVSLGCFRSQSYRVIQRKSGRTDMEVQRTPRTALKTGVALSRLDAFARSYRTLAARKSVVFGQVILMGRRISCRYVAFRRPQKVTLRSLTINAHVRGLSRHKYCICCIPSPAVTLNLLCYTLEFVVGCIFSVWTVR